MAVTIGILLHLLNRKNMKKVNISLTKKFYGVKGALHVLDEEIKSFNINPKTSKEFFNPWVDNFY